MIEQEKREYELAVLLENEVAEIELAKFLPGASLIGSRSITLSYPIKKHQTAFLCVYNFLSLPEVVANLKKELQLQPYILRFLLITPPIRVVEKQVKPIKQPAAPEIKPPAGEIASNELLEKTLEQILQ